jgi:hypothetical protein
MGVMVVADRAAVTAGALTCDDHIYFAFHQLHCKHGNARGIAAGRPKDQFDIVPLGIRPLEVHRGNAVMREGKVDARPG